MDVINLVAGGLYGLSELTKVLKVASSSAMTVLLKCTGGGMSKRGWLNGVNVLVVAAADQEMNCKL